MLDKLLFNKKALFLQIEKMKYSELERLLRRSGCYDTGDSLYGHPKWYSPITGKHFAMSHHHSSEVKTKTLITILKDAGID